jgi:hypothetical protein
MGWRAVGAPHGALLSGFLIQWLIRRGRASLDRNTTYIIAGADDGLVSSGSRCRVRLRVPARSRSTPRSTQRLAAMKQLQGDGSAYMQLPGTRPNTIAQLLADPPALLSGKSGRVPIATPGRAQTHVINR